MADINYEECYFKLKKSNEELTILINKVINDLKQTKSQLFSEKDKNTILAKRNTTLEKQSFELTSKYDAQQHELEDLKDEMSSLKTYSKAVEGVAENFCGKNMAAETKYNKLKRQSTMIFSKFNLEGHNEISIDDGDDIDSPTTPTGNVVDISEIKKTYEEKLAKEKTKKTNLRDEIKKLKEEMEVFKENIDKTKSLLEEKTENSEKVLKDASESQVKNETTVSEFEILTGAYNTLEKDHTDMMGCFSPFLKMKAENLDLKRTSAILLNDTGTDSRLMQFMQIIDELKTENISKDLRIKELQSDTDAASLTIEISSLKLQLEELTENMAVIIKDRDTLKHENRILQEQKGGPGIPPPPPPPAPPPPPPSNPIAKLFKRHNTKTKKLDNATPEDTKLADMMGELQRKLENRVRNNHMKKHSVPTIQTQELGDVTDTVPSSAVKIRLRSNSSPNINPSFETKKNELQEMFKKKNIAPIHEDS